MTSAAVRTHAEAARRAALRLGRTTDAERRDALQAFARLLDERRAELEEANAADVEAAQAAVEAGELSQALADRLPLHGAKLDQAIAGVRAVAELPDPVGRTLRSTRLDDGLELFQVTVPIGVIACAFESRPDAAVQVASLCMRTGNAVLLKGGKEAARSNAVVATLARDALDAVGLPADGVVPITGREELQGLLALDDLVDLVVPRGSNAFVRYVQDNTRVAVLGHADGVCHTYVDADADLDGALQVCLDAKLDYPAACNATECFLVHEAIADALVPRLVDALAAEGITVFADEGARKLAPGTEAATDAEWGREFADLACAVKLVANVDEAIDHINTFGSGHTDAILTEDDATARAFLAAVDSAGVFVNASTRFADGFRYGLGAEVGISTGKVHARGPVGLDGLTTTKWLLLGDGHVAAPYQGEDARAFKHEPMEGPFHDR